MPINTQKIKYIPEVCGWELTLRCNMRCMHCGSIAGASRKDELSLEECYSVADQLAQLGCKNVTLIGGEIFLYDGWEKVAKRLSDLGVSVNTVTNGFLINEKQIGQIKYAGLKNVAISIDGVKKVHDEIRRVNGSFDKAIYVLNKLHHENISTAVVTTLLELNFADLEKMYDIFVQNKVLIWQLQIATFMGNMLENKDLGISPSKIVRITEFIKNKRKENKIHIFAGDNIGYYDENESELRNFLGIKSRFEGCQAGLRGIGINSIGDVKGCNSLYSDEFIEGNIRRESLKEIWENPNNFKYNRKFDKTMLKGKCANCGKAELCRGGCRSSNYFSTGNLHESYYCCYIGKRPCK